MIDNYSRCTKHDFGVCDGYALGKCAGKPGGSSCMVYLFEKIGTIDELKKAIEERDKQIKLHKIETEILRERVQHLLKSEYIRAFDEKNPCTHEYNKPIYEADAYIKQLERTGQIAEYIKSVAFICDRKKCNPCTNAECFLTRDINHAKYFINSPHGYYTEVTSWRKFIESIKKRLKRRKKTESDNE